MLSSAATCLKTVKRSLDKCVFFYESFKIPNVLQIVFHSSYAICLCEKKTFIRKNKIVITTSSSRICKNITSQYYVY